MPKAKFLLSKKRALQQFNKAKGLADIVSYSSKTNQAVTKILERETNCLFSIHMPNELKHIQDKSRAIFLAQAWSQQEIESLLGLGVKRFVVDNEPDLDALVSFLESHNKKISLLLRARLKERTLKTGRYFVFGLPSKTVNRKVKELRGNKKLKGKLKQLGIHFHRKTQNMSEWNLQYEVSQMLDKETLQLIDLINIGGGLPVQYANTNKDVLPGIFLKIASFRKWLRQHKIKLMVEPGRFIAGPATKLVAQILAIHNSTIVVNASVYNADMDALIVPVKLLVESELQKGQGKPYSIKGITPCSMDLFRYRVYLHEPKPGQSLVFLNAGAYNFSTNFCDLQELETEIVD